VTPFTFALIAMLPLMILFPQLALYLPRFMK
jgi:hypothetical protein